MNKPYEIKLHLYENNISSTNIQYVMGDRDRKSRIDRGDEANGLEGRHRRNPGDSDRNAV